MLQKGFFITFEGGDGAGKSTLIKKVEYFFRQKKLEFISTVAPGGTSAGKEIRVLLLKSKYLSIKTELFLYLADRAQHIAEVILPNLNENKIILCDRFNDSTIAYQGYARSLNVNEVTNFCKFASDDITPNLTIYLDIDPKIGLSRIKGKFDRIEKETLSFHQKIRDGFLHLAEKEKERFVIIDATLSFDEVLKKAIKAINAKLNSAHARLI